MTIDATHNDIDASPDDERRGPGTILEGLHSSIPNLCDEFRDTIRGLIDGAPPETVTHALLIEGDDALTREGIAATVGRPTYEIDGVLAVLEEDGWLIRFVENGLEKYMLKAAPARSQAVSRL